MIDVSPLDAIEVGDGVVRVGAGAQLGAIYDALDAHGLTIAGGCGTTVGVSGLASAAASASWGARTGCWRTTSAPPRWCSPTGAWSSADDDLLWGLRGAGGARFGVVTALEIATVREPVMTAFETFWDDPAAAIAAWQAWAPDAPDALAASLLITTPPLQVKVFGAFAGPIDEARALVAALGRPAEAAFAEGNARDAKRFLAGLGGAGEEDDGHAYLRSEFLAEPLSAAAIEALVAHLDEGGFHRELDFSPWGGAYNRVARRRHRVPAPRRPLPAQARGGDRAGRRIPGRRARGSTARGRSRTRTARAARTSTSPRTASTCGRAEYLGANRERLLELKRRYDPEGVFG